MQKDHVSRKGILAAIGSFSRCLEASFLEKIYGEEIKKNIQLGDSHNPVRINLLSKFN